MSARYIIALLVCLPVTFGWGQVTVELSLEKDMYLADEAMMASVKITNFSGRTLNFGRDNHWLMFSVEGRDGFLVDQEGTPAVKGLFQIPNASRGTRRINLAPYYKMRTPGEYQITATVFSDEMKEVLRSPQVKVNIIRATTLWQKQVGVAHDGQAGYEVRNYSLIRALDDNKLMLYVRVASQNEDRVFGVFRIGNLVSFGSPEAQVDRYSNLHVLQQYGARSFRYLVVTPDGELMIRHRYDYTQSRPKLGSIAEDAIGVVGGIRVPVDTDLPPTQERLDQLGEPSATTTTTTAAAVNPGGE